MRRAGAPVTPNGEEDDGRLYDDEPENELADCERCWVCHRYALIAKLDLAGLPHCAECVGKQVACDACGTTERHSGIHSTSLGEQALCNECDRCAVCGRWDTGGMCPTCASTPQAWEAGDL